MTGALAADTLARSKAVSPVAGATAIASVAGAAADVMAGSERLRWELIPAVREALAGVIAAPMDPSSALEAVVPRAATRFQIVVAVFSMLDQSRPPSPAALQPAKVTVPHNSTSASCRRLPIARLPPFGYRKVRRTAPAHDRIDCHLTVAPSKARTLRIIPFRKCVAEIQPLAHLGHRPVADFAANLNARLADRRTGGRTPLDLGRLWLGDRVRRLLGRARPQ